MRSLSCILLFVLCWCPALLQAQFMVEGEVRDSLSNKPVTFGAVILKGTTRGSTTDENGKFSLDVGSLPCELVFSSLGHRAKTVWITEKKVSILLSPLIRELPEAVVDDSPYVELKGSPLETVLDFAFYDDKLLLLIRRFGAEGGKFLELMSEQGTVLSSMEVEKKAEALFTDCMEYVHLLTETKASQVFYDYEKLQLLYPESRQRLELTMQRCEASRGEQLYFRYPSYRSLRMNYLQAQDGKMTEFYQVEDSLKTLYLRRKFDLNYYLKLRKQGHIKMTVDALKSNLDNLRMRESLDWADSKILAPVFAPLVRLKNVIYIGDFANGRFIAFNDKLQVSSIYPVDFHKDPDWKEELLRDRATDELYARFERNGSTTIALLDPTDFQIASTTVLPEKAFLKGLKIRNGKAWFIDKDLEMDGIYRLFSIPLEIAP